MNEQIPGGTPPPVADDKPAPEPTPNPTSDLEARVNQMASSIETLSNALRQALETPAPEPPAPRAPEPTGDEYLDRLARQPRETITETASEAARRVAREDVGPMLNQVLDTAGRIVLNEKAQQIDQQFGTGVFQEEFTPILDKNLAELRKINPRATADPEAIQALVDRIKGQKLDVLIARREAHGKTMAEQRERGIKEIVSAIPSGGGRFQARSPRGGELPEGYDQFAREIEASTGEPMDKELFAKLHGAGNTIDDFLRVTKSST